MVQPHMMASSKLMERMDGLPKIGSSVHDIEGHVKPHMTTMNTVTQKKRMKGPNVPPQASRLKQTHVASSVETYSATDLAVSGVNNNQVSDEHNAKVEEWSSRNKMDLYTILNSPDERNIGDQVSI